MTTQGKRIILLVLKLMVYAPCHPHGGSTMFQFISIIKEEQIILRMFVKASRSCIVLYLPKIVCNRCICILMCYMF